MQSQLLEDCSTNTISGATDNFFLLQRGTIEMATFIFTNTITVFQHELWIMLGQSDWENF